MTYTNVKDAIMLWEVWRSKGWNIFCGTD